MRRAWVLIAITATGCGGTATQAKGPPASFAPNRGQFARNVRFAAQGAGYALAAKDGGLELALDDQRVHVAIPGRPRAGAALPGKANYFLGDLRRTDVPTYAGVAYEHAWPGVDVDVYGTAGRFEYDLRLSPGADPGAIALAFDPPATLARDGSLHIGGLTQPPPATRQGDRTIPSGYVINPDGTVGFRLGRYDRTKPLTIDPVLAYSAYLGGSGNDDARAIAVGATGSAYVTGQTQSANFPGIPGPKPNGDAFVAKLAPDGRTIEWTTFLGGSDVDQGNGIAVAGDGVVVDGSTASLNFPTTAAIQTTRHGDRDAFVARLSATGVPVWSTYLGGGGFEDGNAVAVDAGGNAYVAGMTHSEDFPGTPPRVPADSDDAFATKLTAAGALAYSTRLGGDGNDYAA